MAKTILAFHSLHPVGYDSLTPQFEVLKLWNEKDPEQVIRDHANNIVAITGHPNRPVTRKLIEALPNLEIICNFAVGFDNVDLAAAKERGIPVTNTPDVLTADTADTAVGLLMNVARRFVEGDMFVRVGKWLGGNVFPLGVSLAGKTAGIVGLGRIGAAIAKRLEAFDMKIVYHGRAKKQVPYEYFESLQEMAEAVDFLVLSCAGGEATRNLVDREILKALGPKGFLINVARGSVVDEEALLIALSNRQIAGAGLDVFAREPYVPEALLRMDNVVLLPHIGSATQETRTKMGRLVIDNLLAHFEGRPLLTPV